MHWYRTVDTAVSVCTPPACVVVLSGNISPERIGQIVERLQITFRSLHLFSRCVIMLMTFVYFIIFTTSALSSERMALPRQPPPPPPPPPPQVNLCCIFVLQVQ